MGRCEGDVEEGRDEEDVLDAERGRLAGSAAERGWSSGIVN